MIDTILSLGKSLISTATKRLKKESDAERATRLRQKLEQAKKDTRTTNEIKDSISSDDGLGMSFGKRK